MKRHQAVFEERIAKPSVGKTIAELSGAETIRKATSNKSIRK